MENKHVECIVKKHTDDLTVNGFMYVWIGPKKEIAHGSLSFYEIE